jgi:hypothetical protein
MRLAKGLTETRGISGAGGVRSSLKTVRFSVGRHVDLQTQVTLRSSQRRARPAIVSQDLTYSTFWNPVSIVTLVPVTLPCT